MNHIIQKVDKLEQRMQSWRVAGAWVRSMEGGTHIQASALDWLWVIGQVIVTPPCSSIRWEGRGRRSLVPACSSSHISTRLTPGPATSSCENTKARTPGVENVHGAGQQAHPAEGERQSQDSQQALWNCWDLTPHQWSPCQEFVLRHTPLGWIKLHVPFGAIWKHLSN